MIYRDYIEFYNAIKDGNLTAYPTLTFFINAVTNINFGCGCQKNSRIDLAKAKYTALYTELTDPEKQYLKATIDNNIEFRSDKVLLGKI